jgi:LPXTG-motif cell wall-anchored protein
MRIALTKLCCLTLVCLTAGLIAAPSGFAQSAGDEQYVDPFQGEQGSGGGGGGSGDSGDPSTGTETPAPAPAPPSDTSGVTTPAESGSEVPSSAAPVLPRTGLPVLAAFGAGALLLSGGFVLRRRA